MRPREFVKKLPADIADGLNGQLEVAKVLAQAFEANKAVEVTVYNQTSHKTAKRRLRIAGFGVETLLKDGKPCGHDLYLGAATTWWDFQSKAWSDKDERYQYHPVWCIIQAAQLEEDGILDAGGAQMVGGMRMVYPKTVGMLRSQGPQLVTARVAAEMLASGEWSATRVKDVLEA